MKKYSCLQTASETEGRFARLPPYDRRMQVPDTDTSEYAALIEFAATSGRSRIHPSVTENAGELIARMLSTRADAMTRSLIALAKAGLRKNA